MDMKTAFFIVFALAGVLFFSGCSRSGAEAERGVGADSVSYHRIAKELLNGRAPFDSVLAMEERAVEELRAGRSTDDAVAVLQQMGYLYSRAGRYGAGADYLLEAVDSLNHRPEERVDSGAAAYLYGNLANLYVRMGMYEDALGANRKGLDYSYGQDELFGTNLWRMRGGLFAHMELWDSVPECYEKALENCKGLPLLTASVLADRGEFVVRHPERYSREEVVRTVDEMKKLENMDIPAKNGVLIYQGIGKVYLGDSAEGIRLMEAGLDSMRVRQDVEMVQYTEKHLLNAYARTGRGAELGRLFPEYDALCDTLMNREKINSVVSSEFRFRTREKAMEAEMWKERSATALKVIILQWIAIVLAVLLVGLFAWTGVRKLRKARRVKEQMHQRMLTMMEQQKGVNATIEALNARIEELNAEVESRSDEEHRRKVIAEMPTCLLSASQEALFRRYFMEIYPHFIPDLRRDFPTVTANDELISMLIYMKYSSEEIALNLGISRQSVNTARYRLRKKLGLDKETDLDMFMTSRKG